MAACWRAISTRWKSEGALNGATTAHRAKQTPGEEDFRTRVAAERRERMRTRLLEALLDLYRPGEQHDGLVIDDVLKAAGVARGTFYKYFPSLEAAVQALGERLITEMIGTFQTVYAPVNDPAVRAMGGLLVVFVRSWHDPRWGAFTGRVDFLSYFGRNQAFDIMVRDCLLEARTSGAMHFANTDAAVDLLIGTSIEARRRMIERPRAPRAYIDSLMQHIFGGLAMERSSLARALDQSWDRLLSHSQIMPWMTDENIWRAG